MGTTCDSQGQLFDSPARHSASSSSDPVMPLPYVPGGPENQREFLNELIRLQLQTVGSASPNWRRSLLSRMALVEKVQEPGEVITPIAASLERTKQIGTHWNTSYYAHGWHRYVGRFPPQLVRAVLNHFGAGSSSMVLDPFVGSGTTSVECMLMGIPSVGVEISPLSALIARAKSYPQYDVKGLRDAAAAFEGHYHEAAKILSKLESYDEIIRGSNGLLRRFPNLERWFTLEAFRGVAAALHAISAGANPRIQDLLLCCLSASMRSIGNVDVDVVRAEYSRAPRTQVDVKRLLLRKLDRVVRDVALASSLGVYPSAASARIVEGDIRDVVFEDGSFDCIVTSPPYGIECISYLRTHLLSFRVLASFLKEDPYEFGRCVVGSEYADQELSLNAERECLHSVVARRFFKSFDDTGESTRSRAAQMCRFFVDLDLVVAQLSRWTRKNGKVCFVIGEKKLGDEVIPTRDITDELFALRGFRANGSRKHKLKCNNTNAQTPWEHRSIQDEYILFYERT